MVLGAELINNYRRNCLMIMCSKCKKRPAVVFITSVQGNEKKNEGLCLSCARSQNIPQIKDYMDKLGITDEELDQLSDQMIPGDHTGRAEETETVSDDRGAAEKEAGDAQSESNGSIQGN